MTSTTLLRSALVASAAVGLSLVPVATHEITSGRAPVLTPQSVTPHAKRARADTVYCRSCQPPMSHGSGEVMGATTNGQVTVVPIWWTPPGTSYPADYISTIDAFLHNVAAASGSSDNIFSVGIQYTGLANGQQVPFQYNVRAGADINVTDPVPAPPPDRATCAPASGFSSCTDSSQVELLLRSVVATNHLPADSGHLYPIFTPPGMELCDNQLGCHDRKWCGFHTSTWTADNASVYYDVEPFLGTACSGGMTPNSPIIDPQIDTLSHELMESFTDPGSGGWRDSGGNEIADLCNFIYGPPVGYVDPANTHSGYNQVIGSGKYWIQNMFSNAAFAATGQKDGCVPSSTAPPPASSVTVAVSASPTSVPNDGSSTSTINVTATRTDGSPLPAGDWVAFAVGTATGGSCGTMTPDSSFLDAQGKATATYIAGTANANCAVVVSEKEVGAASQVFIANGTPPPPAKVTRAGGSDREATAADISQASFPAPGSANAVLLASARTFPDALAGTPLAAKLHAPVLLTDPAVLSGTVSDELARVLPKGSQVTILGGTLAVSTAVEQSVNQLGYPTRRLAGPDRYATAVTIADALGDPNVVVEATGLNFPDALAAGTTAAKIGGAVLLTAGTAQSAPTASYLAAHGGAARVALGGPAATADPDADPIVGQDRFATAADAADAFFDAPTAVGIASGDNFPDALAGGAMLAELGAPVLLVHDTSIPGSTIYELYGLSATVNDVWVYGGSAAVNDQVAQIAGESST